MIATETKITPTAVHLQNKGNEPFFKKQGQGNLFTKSNEPTAPFFNPTFIQPKLTIGQPNEEYEKEADAMADKVMRMPDVKMPIQRKCAHCEEEEKQKLQKKSEPDIASGVPSGIESSLASSKGNGRPLPSNVRAQMEHSFGADFSGVKLHTDSHAVQMNNDLHAQAFTHGNDIYFNAGKYHPEVSEGKHLLAHELTHVMQQGGSKITLFRQVSDTPTLTRSLPGCSRLVTEVLPSQGNPSDIIKRAHNLAILLAERGRDAPREQHFQPEVLQYFGSRAEKRRGHTHPRTRNRLRSQFIRILQHLNQGYSLYRCQPQHACEDQGENTGAYQVIGSSAPQSCTICPAFFQNFWRRAGNRSTALILIHEAAHGIGVSDHTGTFNNAWAYQRFAREVTK